MKRTTTHPEYGRFSRKTFRPYTHVVLSSGRSEAWVARTRKFCRARALDMLDYHTNRLNQETDPSIRAESITRIEAINATLATGNDNVDQKYLAKQTRPQCVSWHASAELAHKALAKAQKEGWAGLVVWPVDALEQ